MKKEDLNLNDLPVEALDESISESDFKLVDDTNRVHEQRFQTRPTTFFLDSVKRFCKNKSSVVAAGILGILIIMSFVIPAVDTNDITVPHPEMTYLEPKLFNSGSGFWDGTKKWENVTVDVSKCPNATTEEEMQEFWWPSPDEFIQSAVTEKKFDGMKYTTKEDKYAMGGYVQFGISGTSSKEYVQFYSHVFSTININDGDIILKNFDLYDIEKLKNAEGAESAVFPTNYSQGKASFVFNYSYDETPKTITLLNAAEKFDVSNLNLTEIIKNDEFVTSNNITEFKDCCFAVRIDNDHSEINKCVLIKAIEFETTNSSISDILSETCFTDPNALMLRKNTENGYWLDDGTRKLYMAKAYYCSFVYDSYEAVFGTMIMGSDKIFESDIERYKAQKWCTFDYTLDIDNVTNEYYIVDFSFEVKSDKCPVKEIVSVVPWADGGGVNITAKVDLYKYYGYSSSPRFIMGTDKNGRDMLKYVFEGLRTSLLLGFCSFLVCFTVGLIWGSISGYFGGNVDLLMERFTDILSGLPWVVLMTLVIKHLGQTFFVFGLSICLTGWIGTASTTRTQFYRFRGREYVLASRSLGASDARLIAKHILPNAMGTIITSSVLMIPSVVFSEATISYLGLGLKGMSSLGVILSDNQVELFSHPYLLIFPSVVIALLMISFNLFGNGLRDAVNPSLKGED